MPSPARGGRLDHVADPALFTPRTPRIVAARRLQRRRDRDSAGRFLAEGPQAVREALARAGIVARALRHPRRARPPRRAGSRGARRRRARLPGHRRGPGGAGRDRRPAGRRGASAGSSTCRWRRRWPPGRAWSPSSPSIRDPGNAGTVLRTADAAGAGAVIFAGETVDPYNGKCVRASAGSLFHIDVVRAGDPHAVLAALRGAGLTVFAATGYGETDLDDLADARWAGRTHRLALRLRGARPARRPDRRRRRPRPGAAARARGEPQPGCGRRRLPVRFGQRTAFHRPGEEGPVMSARGHSFSQPAGRGGRQD